MELGFLPKSVSAEFSARSNEKNNIFTQEP